MTTNQWETFRSPTATQRPMDLVTHMTFQLAPPLTTFHPASSTKWRPLTNIKPRTWTNSSLKSEKSSTLLSMKSQMSRRKGGWWGSGPRRARRDSSRPTSLDPSNPEDFSPATPLRVAPNPSPSLKPDDRRISDLWWRSTWKILILRSKSNKWRFSEENLHRRQPFREEKPWNLKTTFNCRFQICKYE